MVLSGQSVDDAARQFAFRICQLKWAFNAKADLVIHLPDGHAICVEIKVDSNESTYTAVAGYRKMSQTELQTYILQDLLGYEKVVSVFLSPGETLIRDADDHGTDKCLRIGTRSVIDGLASDADRAHDLPFVERMLRSSRLGVTLDAVPG